MPERATNAQNSDAASRSSASTPDEVRQWEADGYLALPGAVGGSHLARLQRAFDHWAAECKDAWLERVAAGDTAGTYYDIPDPLAKDDAFLGLVDHPSYYDRLLRFTDGELLFLAAQVRTVPVWPLAYCSWHPDVGRTNPLHIKVQIYVNDVPPNGGEFAFVPGSHREEPGLRRRPLLTDAMPGGRAFPGSAGDAVVFNAYGWHTPMQNRTDTPRKSIILIYERATEARRNAERYAHIADRLSDARRQLLGVAS
ncbi:hypothetical protein HN371_07145 [Candidatus Poribacteria bacterium]|jgi:hypothetical protein|nr:hypothetical protein [Candidatus Poribacteria bacterium]MBT5536193.1 hypothetical protein [Candidatus Poribacteria bacterium]MBT7807107.1 hypothetical protein [Candidatus Poribacteria bacterium]